MGTAEDWLPRGVNQLWQTAEPGQSQGCGVPATTAPSPWQLWAVSCGEAEETQRGFSSGKGLGL